MAQGEQDGSGGRGGEGKRDERRAGENEKDRKLIHREEPEEECV